MIDNTKILRSLKIQLKNTFNERIENVVLVGSETRNTGVNYSVLDILITTTDLLDWQEKSIIRDICYDISIDFGILIDSKIVSAQQTENIFIGNFPFNNDALNFGIHA